MQKNTRRLVLPLIFGTLLLLLIGLAKVASAQCTTCTSTNSAVIPSTFMEFTRSTNASGNDRSIPNKMPIFFKQIS